MNPTSLVLRWYRQSTGGAHSQQQYRAEEVLELLRPANHADADLGERTDDSRAARAEAVRQVATRPAIWLGRLSKQQRQEIGELADRLPSLVFHHAIGGDPADMVRRFGGWSSWRYERALEAAAACIASQLNSTALV
jgi:hypothetical protein